MNNKFRGWDKVFSFTYGQNMKSMSYRVVTILVAVALFAASFAITYFGGRPDESGEGAEGEDGVVISAWAEEVFVLDLANVGELSFESLKEAYGFEEDEITFSYVTGMTEEELAVHAAKAGDFSVGVVLAMEEGALQVRAVVPSTSALELEDGQMVAEMVGNLVETARMQSIGLDPMIAAQLQKEVVTAVVDAGEEVNPVVYLVRYIAPAIFGLVLYFMLLFYGQNINREVSTEKTSKLMETLLTSLHPYALLTGKVFAVVLVALQQFLLWIVALVGGIVGGFAVLTVQYPGYAKGISTVIEFLQANIGESAFSPVAVVLSLVTFCFGFLFYCILSGMSGSMVSRPEDAANTQSIFVLPVVISWLVCYFGSLMENEALLAVVRNIPFTIPFCVPVDLLTGAIGLGQGLVSMAILLVFSLLVIMLSGRIYRGMVLYNGQKINLKTIAGILTNK